MTYIGGETQHDRILDMLRHGPTCGSEFLSVYLPTYSQRIGELIRRKGYRIYRVECHKDYHNHTSGVATYELSKHQGGTYDDTTPEPSLFEPEPPEFFEEDASQIVMEREARERDEGPDPEPPGDDVEDTFHTNIVWPDDEADSGHDSVVDQALGEGYQ